LLASGSYHVCFSHFTLVLFGVVAVVVACVQVASMRGKDALRTFYERAKDTWSYHTRYPDLPVKHGPDVDAEKEPKVCTTTIHYILYCCKHSLSIKRL
jgi:hypothetical protein